MKIRKKLWAMILTVAIVLTMMPTMVFADTGDELPDVFKPVDVVVDTSASSLKGTVSFSIEPNEYILEERGYKADDYSNEQLQAFAWRTILNEGGEVNSVKVAITDKTLTDKEKEKVRSLARAEENSYDVKDENIRAYDVKFYFNGSETPEMERFYSGLKISVNGFTLGENFDGYFLGGFNEEEMFGLRNYDLAYDEQTGTYTWGIYSGEEAGFVVAEGTTSNKRTIPVEKVVVDNATLQFEAGDEVVFTGTVGSDLYEFNDFAYEMWEDDNYKYATTSEYYKANNADEIFDKFEYNKSYNYSVGVCLTEEAYIKGYYFTDDTRLILNGDEYEVSANTSNYLEDDDRCVEFWNIKTLEFGEDPNAGTKPTGGEVTTPTTPSNDQNKGTGSSTIAPKAQSNTVTTKAASKLSVKAKKVKAKANKKTKIKKAKAFKITGAAGKVTFKKVKGDKKISVSKSGKVTVKKGLKKGKTYKVKVQVTDAGSATVESGSKTVTLKVKIK